MIQILFFLAGLGTITLFDFLWLNMHKKSKLSKEVKSFDVEETSSGETSKKLQVSKLPQQPHSATADSESANARSSNAFLELENQGEVYRLYLREHIHRLGRDPSWSDIAIPASWEGFSRRHTILRKEGNSYRIFNGDGKVPSRNGLFIDNHIAINTTEGYLLKHGDIVTLGRNPSEQIRITYFNLSLTEAQLVERETAIFNGY